MFLESPRFPLDVSYSSDTGTDFVTWRVTFGANGQEYSDSKTTLPRKRYNVVYNNKTRAKINEFYRLFNVVKGSFGGFRVKDIHDFTSNPDGRTVPAQTDITLGTGNGVLTQYQLFKPYTVGLNTLQRTIKKPVTGTVKVEVNGVTRTEGVHFTVNYTTGVVTFTVAPGNGLIIKAGFEFDVPCRFDTDSQGIRPEVLRKQNFGNDIFSADTMPLIEIR